MIWLTTAVIVAARWQNMAFEMAGKRTLGSLDCFFFQAEDGIRDIGVTGVQTCALPICTRFTAIPNWHTGMPLFVNLSSGSLVRLPARTTRLKLTICNSFPRVIVGQVYEKIGRASCRERV